MNGARSSYFCSHGVLYCCISSELQDTCYILQAASIHVFASMFQPKQSSHGWLHVFEPEFQSRVLLWIPLLLHHLAVKPHTWHVHILIALYPGLQPICVRSLSSMRLICSDSIGWLAGSGGICKADPLKLLGTQAWQQDTAVYMYEVVEEGSCKQHVIQ